MTNYIEYELENGGSVILEVNDSDDTFERGGLIQVGINTDKVLAKADQTFDAAIENVRNAADILLNKLKTLHDSPNEIEITFGLKASGELGGNFLVAKAGLEANYSVKLKWTRND